VIRFIFSRLLQSCLVLLIMSFVIYLLIGLMPGDPIDLMLSADPNMTSADAARLRALQGMDQHIFIRWLNWLQAALTADFGYSRLYAAPAFAVLEPALWNTLKLLGASLLLSLLISIPCGISAALKPYSIRDYSINFIAFAGISIPVFWLGLMLIIVFAVLLNILPASGTGSLTAPGFWDSLRYLILPVATLTIGSVGGHTRFMRGAMLEVMRQDYIRTARAKGAGIGRIVYKHALRNAMLPVVTILALECGTLFSGALITETVFAWPGMGKLIYDSILGNDFNLALAALLMATSVTLLCNLIADLTYSWLDPRISHR
jgi:peptide/nickel transport system permease protein